MKKITVEKPAQEKLDARRVRDWGIWEHETARFDWYYDQTEECYFLAGRVIVETEDGQKVAKDMDYIPLSSEKAKENMVK